MNIISTIGRYIKDGMTHAEVVAKLDVDHGVQVSEMWLKKIIGADGFTAVLDQVELATGLEGVATPSAPTTAEHVAAMNAEDKTIDRTTLADTSGSPMPDPAPLPAADHALTPGTASLPAATSGIPDTGAENGQARSTPISD